MRWEQMMGSSFIQSDQTPAWSTCSTSKRPIAEGWRLRIFDSPIPMRAITILWYSWNTEIFILQIWLIGIPLKKNKQTTNNNNNNKIARSFKFLAHGSK